MWISQTAKARRTGPAPSVNAGRRGRIYHQFVTTGRTAWAASGPVSALTLALALAVTGCATTDEPHDSVTDPVPGEQADAKADGSGKPGRDGAPKDDDKGAGASSRNELIPPEEPTAAALGGVPLSTATDGAWTVRAPPPPSARERAHGDFEGGALAPEEAEMMAAPEVSMGAPSGSAGGGGLRGLEGAPPPASPAGDGDGDDLAGVRRIRPAPQTQGPLRAGSTDDNADLPGFLLFLEAWQSRPDLDGKISALDVSERKLVKVVGREGAPLPGAEVRILDENTEALKFLGTTYGDGVVPVFPRVSDIGSGAVIVEARYQGRQVNERWDFSGEHVELTIDAAAAGPVPLDAVFLIDTTGSMGDEIAQIKATLLKVTERLRKDVAGDVDLRYGAVLYKDLGDEYVTRTHPFTRDIAAFDEALRTITAGGGGDFPESLNQGLAQAVAGVAWRRTAAKVVFLIADAPPHTDYQDDIPYGESLKDALARGVRIHAVAASGLDPFGSLVFRQTAQYTRGRFIFIEYGTPAASAEKHGVAGPLKSNNLDDILYDRLRWELDHYAEHAPETGAEPAATETAP